jgi:cyclic pyranopterin phosphate synthase
MIQELQDAQGRRFRYLRLSVTDACNFRCTYCLPNGYAAAPGAARVLDLEEIGRLLAAFAELGVEKVRITGGEPTLRRDVVDIVARAASTQGVKRVALTTNGYRLASLAPRLAAAGLAQVNVSVDSLEPATFRDVTGWDALAGVMDGIEACLGLGLEVKVNAVLMRGVNDESLATFLDWVRTTPVSVRFIELMKTLENGALFKERHVPVDALRRRLLAEGFQRKSRGVTDGPAETYLHEGYRGSIGLIAPYAKDFCGTCNRLRVSSRGALHLCLFGKGGLPLRQYLADDASRGLLKDEVLRLLEGKAPAHFLHAGDSGATRNLSGIGG